MKKELTNQEINQHRFFAVPYVISHDRNIKDGEEKVFSYILVLSRQTGFCYASNKGLGKMMNKSEATIKRAIANLVKNGYLKNIVNESYKSHRAIYPLVNIYGEPINQELEGGMVKNDLPPLVKDELPSLVKNDPQNRYNLNRELLSNKNEEGQKQVLTHFPDNLNDYQQSQLKIYVENLGVEVVRYELANVIKRNNDGKLKSPFGYLLTTLQDLTSEGITSLEEAKNYHQEVYVEQGIEQLEAKSHSGSTVPANFNADYQHESSGNVSPEQVKKLDALIAEVTHKEADDVPF